MSAPAATVTDSSSLQAIAKAVSARAKTRPPCVTAKPLVMSSRTVIETVAEPGSSRSTTMPSAADARSRCIIGRSPTSGFSASVMALSIEAVGVVSVRSTIADK